MCCFRRAGMRGLLFWEMQRQVEDSALDELAKAGFAPIFGAYP